MADDDQEKSQAASERRLREAWEQGQVPLGRDAVAVASLCAGAFALVSVAGPLRDGLVNALSTVLRDLPALRFGDLPLVLEKPVLLVFGCCCAAALAGVAVTVAQTKGGVWPEQALPDPSRLFQPQRFTRLVSRELLVDLLAAGVKAVALLAVTYAALKRPFLGLGALLGASPSTQLAGIFSPLQKAASPILLTMAALAGADLALTRFRFHQRMRMSAEELKREAKEEDGDPLLRSRRRRKHRELSKARVAVEVPKADALLVNPTHVAVALRYRRGEDKAPKVTAKGKGALAEVMRDLARSNGVPIVQDIPLARLLYKKVKVGKEVPADTYKAVAAILAFVYRLTGREARK